MTNITIEEANKIAERIEKANTELKELLDRKETLQAQEVLNGRSEAGITVIVDKEKEEVDYLNNLLKSTGMHI